VRSGTAPSAPRVAPGVQTVEPRHEPPYHVILYDDDEHTYEYVIEMICQIFGHAVKKAFKMAVEVDKTGRVIVVTCHKELAELRKEQIESHGPDPRIPKCRGSMSAAIEPAE
jgi:ATP-dependent Clp protease adaptor protein ClpS